MLKEDILSSEDRAKPIRVDTPEWKCGHVFVRVITGTELDAYDMAVYKNNEAGTPIVRAELLVRAIADESGKRVFSDDDTISLGAKSGAVLDRLYDAARRINGMSRESQENL